MSNDTDIGTKLDDGDPRCNVVVTDGLENWSDTLREHRDMQDICIVNVSDVSIWLPILTGLPCMHSSVPLAGKFAISDTCRYIQAVHVTMCMYVCPLHICLVPCMVSWLVLDKSLTCPCAPLMCPTCFQGYLSPLHCI